MNGVGGVARRSATTETNKGHIPRLCEYPPPAGTDVAKRGRGEATVSQVNTVTRPDANIKEPK